MYCNVVEAPRALHVTKSVYIRHIAPSVSSADILEVSNIVVHCLKLMLGLARCVNSSQGTSGWHWMDQTLIRSRTT